jgi:hypothetical protein
MKKYKKNPFISVAFVPGIGHLPEGMILEGDEYAKYAPSVLVEIPDGVVPSADLETLPLEMTETSGPELMTETTPSSEVSFDENGNPIPPKRGRGRPRKYPLLG